MITFNAIGNYGRLGNQLFQYAALRALSLENKYEFCLPNLDNRIWHGQKCLLGNFNIVKNFNKDLSTITHRYVEPSIIEYDPSFFNIPDGVDIEGFFQNLKYFSKYKDIICSELTPISLYTKKANLILEKYKKQYPGYEMVSLHIRRGDNLTTHNQFVPLFGNDNTKLDINSPWRIYFDKAKDHFKNKKIKYLTFTGGNRDNNDKADHEWVNNNLGSECILASTPDPMLDYSLIQLCDHNILSFVSSFGWWAAYTNTKPNKTTIIPKNYFVDNSNINRLTDNNWIVI
jgi:hypothetical protein